MVYDPTDSSLTRQQWAYQQKLTDMMGEGLDDLPGGRRRNRRRKRRGGSLPTPTEVNTALGEVASPAPSPEVSLSAEVVNKLASLGLDAKTLTNCGTGFLAAAFAGYVAGKVGALQTAVGVGVAYAVLKGLERQ